MFRTMDDFHLLWGMERALTEQLFRALTDASLSVSVHPDVRTLGRLAGHIVESVEEMGSHLGIGLSHAGEPLVCTSVADALASYRRNCERFEKGLRDHWTDAMLSGEIPMYGEQWSRSKTLAVVIAHQAHHRSQMTVVMRLAGVPVPGLYGPAKQEWAAMGVPAMI